MEILEYIPVSLDIGEIKRKTPYMEQGDDWTQVQAPVEAVQPLISARAVYKVCYIWAKFEDAIVIEGTRFTSKVVRKNLDSVERVFPYVPTIGDRLEEEARACEDLLKQYYLDTIGNVAPVVARRYLEDHLRSRYALDEMCSMSPESLKDCPVEDQRALFAILGDVEGSIGVRLSESTLMITGKSLSGIYFPTEVPSNSCQLCPWERCPSRRAACDEMLAKDYGILN